MKQLVEEAKRMIRTNSVTANGNEEIANYAQTLMQEAGMKTQQQWVTHSLEGVSKRQFNVIGILGDPLVDKKTKKGLLLNTHLDTVGPGLPENWTETGGDPFVATVKDGRVYGLGTADVKLDFLCKLHAISSFREKKLKMPIYLVGTCGEELGMFGVKYLIKSLALNPKFAVVGEPTNMKVVYAHKALNLFRVSIGYHLIERDARGFNRRVDFYAFGKSAHSAYPHLGTNAILSMMEFLQKATDQGFELRYTRFEGGETVNKVADRAMAQFYLTSHQFEDFKRFFREFVKRENKEKAFRVELGGVGEAGVRFLPDALFPCFAEILGFFRGVTADFEKVKDAGYDPPFSTVNFGQLKPRAGGMDLHFDLRLLPDLVADEIQKHIVEGIQKIANRHPHLNVAAVRERTGLGLNTKVDHDLVQACRDAMSAANLEPVLDKKSTSTEAAQYFQSGCDAVVFGPGVSQGNSHSPNEHCPLEHLQKAITFYEKLIERTCL